MARGKLRRIMKGDQFTGDDEVDLEQPPAIDPDMADIEQVGDLEAEGGPGDGS